MACLFSPSDQSWTLTREEKNEFYGFLILFAQFDLLSKSFTERKKRLAESGNEAETRPIFLSFYPFNSKCRDFFTIYHKPVLDI